MFYYPNVLQRHTGCFATIWLAATRGSRLVKREYLKVNVVKTCEEILDYVLVRVQPPQPGQPRPRFSLYLSAQLQIGVIRVYSQQCQYLVEDIQHILERLHRAQLQIRIDMVDTDLPSLLLPNHLAMMETLEDAPDPFFGLMSVDPTLPSPFSIPQIRHLLEAATPEKVLEEAPPEVPMEPPKPDRIPVTVLSPEAITLQEAEPIRMLHIEGEQDLPEISRRDLDLLIAEEDEAILLEERLGRPLRPRRAPPPVDVSKEEPRALEGEAEVPPLSPAALTLVEGVAEPLPVLVPEELKPEGWEPEALPTEVTPPLELRLPAPLSPERRPPVPHVLGSHPLVAAAANYCSGTRRLRSPGRNSRNNCKPEPTAGSVQRCSLWRGPSEAPQSYSKPRLTLAGCPQNCWLSGPTVHSHPSEHSGEGHLRSLRRKKGGWKPQVISRS